MIFYLNIGKPEISVIETSLNVSIKNSKLVIKEGQSCKLFCEVEFSNELKSTLQWFDNNGLLGSSSETYVLDKVNVENDHDSYKCCYNDELDSDFVEINLDVQC